MKKNRKKGEKKKTKSFNDNENDEQNLKKKTNIDTQHSVHTYKYCVWLLSSCETIHVLYVKQP